MSSQRVIIQRTNHLQSVVQVFERLLDNSSLVDCTIAAEGQYLKAHRVMLAACSPYFEVLLSQENTNPIVILKDTKFEDLKAVIDFIYQGKVQIPEGQLQSFANTIESLHIRGMGNAEQCCSDAVTAPEGSHITLLPMSGPLVERNEVVMQQEDGNLLAAVASEESDIPPAQSPPLVEETPVPIQSNEALPYNQFAEECKAESSIKIFQSWSESFNKVEVVGMEESPMLLNDEENHARMLTTDLIDEEGEDKVDVEETPILESDFEEFIAKQFTTEESTEENKDEPAGIAPEAAGTAPSDIVLTTQETKATTKQKLPQDEQTTQSSNGSRRHAKKLEEHAERRFNCNECGSSFSHNGHLARHMRTHTGERPYKCDVCGTSVSRQGNLVSHMRKHTGERPYNCDECGKSFSHKHILVSHLRMHTGERPYKCDVCGASFTRQNNLVSHVRRHTGERPYKCEVCGTSYSHQSRLVSHMRKHTGERPYNCDECGKSFSHKHNLVSHLRMHTGERPYKCDVCEASFTQQNNLVSHVRRHTGERPYKCEVCGKSVSLKYNLVRHMQTHTGDRLH